MRLELAQTGSSSIGLRRIQAKGSPRGIRIVRGVFWVNIISMFNIGAGLRSPNSRQASSA